MQYRDEDLLWTKEAADAFIQSKSDWMARNRHGDYLDSTMHLTQPPIIREWEKAVLDGRFTAARANGRLGALSTEIRRLAAPHYEARNVGPLTHFIQLFTIRATNVREYLRALLTGNMKYRSVSARKG